jgi:hypothetical protein
VQTVVGLGAGVEIEILAGAIQEDQGAVTVDIGAGATGILSLEVALGIFNGERGDVVPDGTGNLMLARATTREDGIAAL